MVALPPDIATVRSALQTNAATTNDAVSQNGVIYDRIVAGLAVNPTGEQYG
jgi:hypothetical protein